MVSQIVRKEFLNNLLSARFVIGFLLCLVLIPFSILINIDDYRDQAAIYRTERDAAEKAVKEVRVYSELRPEIVIPPEPLGIFSRGIRGQVGNKVKIQLGEKPWLAEGISAVRDNPFLASFFSIDFVDIAAVIFSLLAILFSYDVFTREKEDGTLKLQMANAVGRAQFLAGKVLGILATLLPVLLFSFLLSAILILASRELTFSILDWGRIALLFGASLLYLAVFIFIGLFISARSKTSVTSLVLCLFVWVFFVFIVPNLSAYVAESFVGIRSRENLTLVFEDLDKEFGRAVEDQEKTLPKADWYMSWYFNGGDDGKKEMYGCTASYFEMERQRSMISEPLRIDYAEKKWAAQEGLSGQLDPPGADRGENRHDIARGRLSDDRLGHLFDGHSFLRKPHGPDAPIPGDLHPLFPGKKYFCLPPLHNADTARGHEDGRLARRGKDGGRVQDLEGLR